MEKRIALYVTGKSRIGAREINSGVVVGQIVLCDDFSASDVDKLLQNPGVLRIDQGDLEKEKADRRAAAKATSEQPDVDYAKLSKQELQRVLKEKGISFEAGAKKEDLLKLLKK